LSREPKSILGRVQLEETRRPGIMILNPQMTTDCRTAQDKSKSTQSQDRSGNLRDRRQRAGCDATVSDMVKIFCESPHFPG
jgi:hypothetical protein